MSADTAIDLGHLERRLEQTVRGEVRFDAGSRAVYANDSSNFRQVPLGVVVPETVEDVVATHRACAEYGAPIVNRGTLVIVEYDDLPRAGEDITEIIERFKPIGLEASTRRSSTTSPRRAATSAR
jgi:hypothetical protein